MHFSPLPGRNDTIPIHCFFVLLFLFIASLISIVFDENATMLSEIERPLKRYLVWPRSVGLRIWTSLPNPVMYPKSHGTTKDIIIVSPQGASR
jgi:hypothetical protein